MDSGEIKVIGACRRNGKLRKIRIATINPELMAEWEELPGQPISNGNGFLRKTWKGRIVVGHIHFDGWRFEENMSVHPAFPYLVVCLFAGVLVKEVFGIKTEKLQVPNNNPCQSCCQCM